MSLVQKRISLGLGSWVFTLGTHLFICNELSMEVNKRLQKLNMCRSKLRRLFGACRDAEVLERKVASPLFGHRGM